MRRAVLLIIVAVMGTLIANAANDSIRKRILDSYVSYGEKYIGCRWESPNATLFAEFKTNGNRTRYEQWTFAKRRQLAALVLAEKVEGKGRFMPDIVNGIMSTLEETWWGIPAHYGTKVMRAEDQNVDLFNAETAGLMAWTKHALQQKIDSFSPLLSQRIDKEIERRMLIPALETDYWWKRASMNWNPWICSNWIACVNFCEHDSTRRDKALAQISAAMDAFVDGYPDDGGCDEGPTYWDRAATSLYECESMMSKDHPSFYSHIASLKKMAAYCYATYVANGYCLSFADSHGNRLVQQPNVMYPFALYVDDPVMRRFAKYIAVEKGFLDDAAKIYDQSGNYPTLGRELVFLSHLDEFLDLTECYPQDVGIKRWLRTVDINKKGVISLTDDYLLKSVEKPVREMFVTAVQPVIDESRGVVSLGSCSLYYPKSKCSVVVEPLSESLDPMLRTMWPDGLWRIVVTARNMTEKDKLVFTITPRR